MKKTKKYQKGIRKHKLEFVNQNRAHLKVV